MNRDRALFYLLCGFSGFLGGSIAVSMLNDEGLARIEKKLSNIEYQILVYNNALNNMNKQLNKSDTSSTTTNEECAEEETQHDNDTFFKYLTRLFKIGF